MVEPRQIAHEGVKARAPGAGSGRLTGVPFPGQTLISPEGQSVGVLIAAFNAADSIDKAVRSALEQPQVTEIWVVDDCSTDQTVAAANAAEDGTGRLRIIEQPTNQGPAAARNVALERSRADWVCVLDADDYFLSGRIARMLNLAQGLELIADDLVRVQAAHESPAPFDEPGDPEVRAITLADFVQGNVSQEGQSRRELGFIKPLMRREFLARHGLAYDPDLRLGEDYVLYVRLLALGARLGLCRPMGYVAVERADSLSGRHRIEDLRALRDRDHELAALRPLTATERRAFRAHYVSLDKRLQWRRLIEAIKAREPATALSTLTSIPVTVSLAQNLWSQLLVRSGLKPAV